MSEDTWSWDHDTCDMPGCTEVAPYRLYVNDEQMQTFCLDHMQAVAAEHAWLWRDVVGIAAAAEHAESCDLHRYGDRSAFGICTCRAAAASADYDPLELEHSPAAIAELLAPVRHPGRGEGDGL